MQQNTPVEQPTQTQHHTELLPTLRSQHENDHYTTVLEDGCFYVVIFGNGLAIVLFLLVFIYYLMWNAYS